MKISKILITYTIVDDDTRNSFVELLGQLDCNNEPDQSTYSLPEDSPLSLVGMKTAIKNWSRGDKVDLKRGDIICLYSPDLSDDETQYVITRKDFKYNLLRKTFVWYK